MKSFLLFALFFSSAFAVPAFLPPNEVDDAFVEGSKAFALLLPAVALPYSVALIAVLVPLAKAFVLGAMNVFKLPFEVLVLGYLLLYVAMFTFPQLAPLLKLTSVLAARSESARATRAAGEPQFHAVDAVMDWARDYVPKWWMAATEATEAPVMTSEPTTAATAEPTTSTTKSPSGMRKVSPPTSRAPAPVRSAKRPGIHKGAKYVFQVFFLPSVRGNCETGEGLSCERHVHRLYKPFRQRDQIRACRP
ncbi:hypothetical protein MRX96_052240 [Rhipicephalus microplus]